MNLLSALALLGRQQEDRSACEGRLQHSEKFTFGNPGWPNVASATRRLESLNSTRDVEYCMPLPVQRWLQHMLFHRDFEL